MGRPVHDGKRSKLLEADGLSIRFQQFGPFFDGSKFELQNEKTMVGFGRTEVLIPPLKRSSRDLSNGHGFRDPCFQGVRKGWVFHDLLNRFLKVFMKRSNEHFQIYVFRAETDTK